MVLPDKAIKEYKEIYKDVYGTHISDSDAREEAYKLIRLYQIIYRNIPKAWLESTI